MVVSARKSGFLSQLPPDQAAAMASSVRAGEYNLFFGAGISLDATNELGEKLPGSGDFKDHLCSITGSRPSSSLQRAFTALTPKQVEQHVTLKFANCEPGPSVEKLPSFVWSRIFTLNIDNVVEEVYRKPGNLQVSETYHFKDPYEDPKTRDVLSVIHLHGYAKQPEKGYVFSRAEYAKNIAESNAWMTVLADIMPVEPFIIAGTALDEVDLEYYITRRSSLSEREDRGPSFFVEPYPDAQTQHECDRYGLTLYPGTLEAFLRELDLAVTERVRPEGLVSGDIRTLFPPDVAKSVVLAFAADFDIVPSLATPDPSASKFAYGHPPRWSDLAGNWDIGRALATQIRSAAEATLSGSLPEQLLIITDKPGVGKTTVLKRVAFDMANAGMKVLMCSALSRLVANLTAGCIDLIDGPVVVVVDSIADQATAISSICKLLKKKDVVFLGADRSYRGRHIVSSLGGIQHRLFEGLPLTLPEATQLVDSYITRGLAAAPEAKRPPRLAARLEAQPIAVACCHILKDLRPLDTIIDTTYQAASAAERDRYLMAALAQVCFSGGVRLQVLRSRTGHEGWKNQFDPSHPLPLAFYDSRNDFVVPLNATLAERTLARATRIDVSNAFVNLALGIAPRVNRTTIRRRSPEAQTARRLFDFEDVISRYLHEGAGGYYRDVQEAWRWNSRYWEQLALYCLSTSHKEANRDLLQQALQHARHAVWIEEHPFTLTTLSKVLLRLGKIMYGDRTLMYNEAFDNLVKAIELEQMRGRTSVHAYVTLFRGSAEFLSVGSDLTVRQAEKIDDLTVEAAALFSRDTELRDASRAIEAALSKWQRRHPELKQR